MTQLFKIYDKDSNSFLKGDFSIGVESGQIRGKYGEVFKNLVFCHSIGIKDKNGKMLFQKDIIRYISENDGETVFISEVDASMVSGIFIHDEMLRMEFSLYGTGLCEGNFEIIGSSLIKKQ